MQSLPGSVFAWIFILGALISAAPAQTFVHPGGLHTQADLDRMKTKVAAGAHPWIDDWNLLISDSEARNTYTAAPQADMGANRQRADADAHAAYLNAIRWYISGDTSYADCAVRICNAWSSSVNQVPSNTGLVGIPIFDFALAAEVLRIYGGWSASDFARFQNMMETYLYPSCHDFLTNHNGSCITSYWANWDDCNIGALIAMGVLCDDSAKFNEGVTYFESGAGNGCITNAVYYLHTPTLGQWQESGRDQEHAQLGIGLCGSFCQVAWNQGVNLFGYASNRLLAGAEYVAQTNLCQPVPYKYYTNCVSANQDWVSINGLGRLDDRPVWELIYNHYAVLEGLSIPNSKAMAQLMRPEHGSNDHFGYGTLTFTLDASASSYPPSPISPAPTGLVATASVGQVALQWSPSSTNSAQGYTVLRSTTNGGPYTSIATWSANTNPQYVDTSVTNGTTYYYVIQAVNQSGSSTNSAQASATPLAAGPLLSGWTNQDLGTASTSGGATYSDLGNGTFLLSGSGAGIGGTSDGGFNYTYAVVTENFTLTARLWNISWNSGGGEVGIMLRESLAANSAEVQMTLGGSGLREARFGIRSSTGANLNHYLGNDYTWTPAWFRLRRSGNTFTAYESSDGVTWFSVGSTTIAMSTTYYAGLVMANGSSTLNTAMLDHVISTAPAAPTGLIAAPQADRVALSWIGSPGATSYSIKRATTSGGPYTTLATGVTTTQYNDETAVSGTTYYYVVSASDPAGDESNDSTEAMAAGGMVTITGFAPYAGSIDVGHGGILDIDSSSGTYAASVIRSSNLMIDGGPTFSSGGTANEPANLLDNGSGAGNTNDFFGPLVIDSGACFVKATPNAAANLRLTFDSLTRSPGTQLVFGHSGNFGGVGTSPLANATAGTTNVVITTAPSTLMVGGGGAAGSNTLSLLPFVFVGNDLTTYDSSYGLRGLNTSTEMSALSSGLTGARNAKITSGTVTLNAATTINALYGSGGSTTGSGTLTITSGAICCAVSFTLGNSTLAFGASEGLLNVANARTLTINSVITGTGGLTAALENYNGASANLVLGGANTYTGTTTIEGNDPNLKVKLTNGLALQNTTLDYNNYGASLQFGSGTTNVTSATLGGLKGRQNLALTNAGSAGGAIALDVGGDGDNTIYGGVLSGSGSLTKIGSGELTLSGPCTYTGSTVVSSGTLNITGSLAAASNVTVNSGGILAGTGTVGGSVSVASGGILSPGGSGAGTLTVGSLTLNGGAMLFCMPGSAPSTVTVGGTYTAPTSGMVTINVSPAARFGAGAYSIITGAKSISADSFTLGAAPSGYNYALSASGGVLSLVVSPPTPPTGLSATAGDGAVRLNWNSSFGATSYDIKRGSASGGPYTVLSTGGTATSQTDTTVIDGTTYYYVVSALNSAGESVNSNEVSATPSQPISQQEQTAPALGVPSNSSSGSNNTITVIGSVAGHTYQLQFATDPQNGPWQNIGAPQAGNGGTLTFTAPLPSSSTSGFYRLLIQR
jgi:autotransporter-associated beta strand protein